MLVPAPQPRFHRHESHDGGSALKACGARADGSGDPPGPVVPVVQLGFLIVYLAWGYGILTVAVGLRLVGTSAPSPAPTGAWRAGVVVAALALVGSLWLPWISGVGAVGGRDLVVSGWGGLDPLSTWAIATLAGLAALYAVLPRAGGEWRRAVLASTAACTAGLVGGNVMIQATEVRGSSVEWGAGVSGTVVVALAIGLITAETVGARPVDAGATRPARGSRSGAGPGSRSAPTRRGGGTRAPAHATPRG